MIIGVVGRANTGKSTVAARLVARHGFTERSFAAPLKRIVADLFGFDDRQLFGPSSAREEPHHSWRMPSGRPLSARAACELIGNAARECADTVWVTRALAEIPDGARVVFADVRYRNEMEAIRARGGRLIRRAVPEHWARKLARRALPWLKWCHPSERELIDMPDSYFDAVLGQYPSKAELYQRVDALVEEWTR